MHGVEVSDQHAPERVNGRNELALEGIDNRMLLLPGTSNRLRPLAGGDEGDGSTDRGVTLISGYHGRVTIPVTRASRAPPHVGKVWSQKLGTTARASGRGTCVTGTASRSAAMQRAAREASATEAPMPVKGRRSLRTLPRAAERVESLL